MTGNGDEYDVALDPLWNADAERDAGPFGKDEIAFYQCDQLGTPQELTDSEGEVAWSSRYKAWRQTKEAISEAAYKAGMRNPIRFQGQYQVEETGLFYNRYRYYDPHAGRYLTQDPIKLAGSKNFYAYAPNPLSRVDPSGLRCDSPAIKLKQSCQRWNVHRRQQSEQELFPMAEFATTTKRPSLEMRAQQEAGPT